MSTDREYRLPGDWKLQACVTPLSEVYDWSQDFLGIPEAWRVNTGTAAGGVPIIVAVVDTGVDAHHPDLAGAVNDLADFTGSINGPTDVVGHGTWCCGCIGARANEVGTRGVAYDCRILSAKVLGDNGSGSDRSIEQGLRWAYLKGARFFSLSLGGRGMGDRLRGLFREFAQEGRFCFAAAGNDGGATNEPAAWPDLCAVAACGADGKLTKFSSFDEAVDIIAPGVEMLGPIPGGRWGKMSGTSMACPKACGVGMLAYGKHATAGQTDLANIADMVAHLRKTARRNAADGRLYLLDPVALLRDEHPPIAPVPPQPQPPGGGFEYPIPGLGISIRVPARAGDYVGVGA